LSLLGSHAFAILPVTKAEGVCNPKFGNQTALRPDLTLHPPPPQRRRQREMHCRARQHWQSLEAANGDNAHNCTQLRQASAVSSLTHWGYDTRRGVTRHRRARH